MKKIAPWIFGPLLITTGLLWAQSVELTSSNLPIMFIDTHGQTIPDANRIEAHMGIIYNGPDERNAVDDPFNHYNGTIGIELRGSTSQMFPKPPLRIETHDSTGQDWNVSLLGMPSENDWVLHNPFSDRSLIRNVISYKMARDLGHYASRTRFIEGFINGEYMGVYVLCEKLKRDKNRIAISELDPTDNSGDQLTGGYIIKIDKTDGEGNGGWMSKKRTIFQYHYPKPADITEEQQEYIQNYMDKIEAVMDSSIMSDPDEGYEKYLDVESFIDYLFVNEITRNIDGYRLSAFMYKDRDSKGGKLVMGPVWDHNLSLGNADYFEGWQTRGWNIETLIRNDRNDNFRVPFWWDRLINDTRFKEKTAERWWQMRDTVLATDKWLNYVDALRDTLAEAADRNYVKWPVLGSSSQIWPNYYMFDTWDEEVQFVKEWLHNRLLWIDANIGGPGAMSATSFSERTVQQFRLAQNYPNPFNSTTKISVELQQNSHVHLEIFDLLGRKIRTLADETKASGFHTFIWDGCNALNESVCSGIYSCRIRCDEKTSMIKMILVR
ncbi:CotH kinase family protein [candidate division KSB1 bacterium]|nr:CotH kinase family protein [candidate division KSB1 bacterium]